MTGSYFVQNSVVRPTCEPYVKSRTLELKPRVYTISNWSKFVGDDLVW